MKNYDNNIDNTGQSNTIIIHLENNRKKTPIVTSETPNEKHSWSSEEQDALLKGIRTYGEGKWQLILNSSDAFHPCRTSVDLKDKFRLLNKISSYYVQKKQYWYEMLDDNILSHDTFGKPITVFTKFPYDAAKAFASMRDKNKEDAFVLKLAKKEQGGRQKIHVYSVALFEGNWKVAKQKIVYTKPVSFTDK